MTASRSSCLGIIETQAANRTRIMLQNTPKDIKLVVYVVITQRSQLQWNLDSYNKQYSSARCPSGLGSPRPNALVDMDLPVPNSLGNMDFYGLDPLADLNPLRGLGPLTKLSENCYQTWKYLTAQNIIIVMLS